MVKGKEVPDSFPALMIALFQEYDGQMEKIMPIRSRGRFRDSITKNVHGKDLLWFDKDTSFGVTSCCIQVTEVKV